MDPEALLTPYGAVKKRTNAEIIIGRFPNHVLTIAGSVSPTMWEKTFQRIAEETSARIVVKIRLLDGDPSSLYTPFKKVYTSIMEALSPFQKSIKNCFIICLSTNPSLS